MYHLGYNRIFSFAGCLCSVAIATAAYGQPATKVYDLKLEPTTYIAEGKGALIASATNKTGHRFRVEHLTILTPVVVGLYARDPKVKLTLQLAKYDWNTPKMSAVTDINGVAALLLRTEGELKILVKGSNETEAGYGLAVWAAKEITPPMPSIFVPFSESRKTHGSAFQWGATLWGVAASVVVILILLDIRKTGTRARALRIALWWAVLFPANLSADEPPPSWKISWPKDAKEWGETKVGAAKALFGAIPGLVKIAGDAIKFAESGKKLSSGDCELIFPASPQRVPIHLCNVDKLTIPTNPGNCASCYTEAEVRLNKVRSNLERLRCIYLDTKNYTSAALALGDSAAGATGIGGLAWTAERIRIETSYKGFQKVYDDKYAELMTSLENSLKAVGTCESMFGEANWYKRFGFIYYEFMVERYRRGD
jgi:hypothetical protein